MPIKKVNFAHGYDFDPSYGYDLDALLQVPAPEEPADFMAFWENLHAQARAVDPTPLAREIHSPWPARRVFEVEYNSVGATRIHGWLTIPRQGAIDRGLVVGHGYGGRDGPDADLPVTGAAAIFPCARGLSRSAQAGIPSNPANHVLYGIQNRHAYILGGCAADTWCAASALIALFPQAATRLDYMGISFGGGVGALALPWDARFHGAHLNVPSFGHQPLRLTFKCVGSGEAVRLYHRYRGGLALETLRYFDAATAARHIRIPVHVAAALFDPAVPPPGQYAVYNALSGPKQLFVLQAGHFGYPEQDGENRRLFDELTRFFNPPST